MCGLWVAGQHDGGLGAGPRYELELRRFESAPEKRSPLKFQNLIWYLFSDKDDYFPISEGPTILVFTFIFTSDGIHFHFHSL